MERVLNLQTPIGKATAMNKLKIDSFVPPKCPR